MVLFAVVFSLACGTGTTTSQQSTPNATATQQARTQNGIRLIDFSQVPEVQNMLKQLGSGTVSPADTLFFDVTGDKQEEAFVPIASGGTLGNVAYLGFTLKGSKPALILTRTLDHSSAGGLRMAVEDGRLVENAGEYGPSDPNCCPSLIRKTYFRWDGSQLQVEKEDKVPNPAGQKKD